MTRELAQFPEEHESPRFTVGWKIMECVRELARSGRLALDHHRARLAEGVPAIEHHHLPKFTLFLRELGQWSSSKADAERRCYGIPQDCDRVWQIATEFPYTATVGRTEYEGRYLFEDMRASDARTDAGAVAKDVWSVVPLEERIALVRELAHDELASVRERLAVHIEEGADRAVALRMKWAKEDMQTVVGQQESARLEDPEQLLEVKVAARRGWQDRTDALRRDAARLEELIASLDTEKLRVEINNQFGIMSILPA